MAAEEYFSTRRSNPPKLWQLFVLVMVVCVQGLNLVVAILIIFYVRSIVSLLDTLQIVFDHFFVGLLIKMSEKLIELQVL